MTETSFLYIFALEQLPRRHEMKLFYMFIFIGMFLGKTASAQTTQVPDVGSVWESLITYAPITEDASVRTKNEVATVDRLVAGRPVFVGEVFGYKGEIIESTVGTVVYTHDCKNDVPAEMLIPPPVPNQCVWHVCNAPPVGQTFTRPMIFFVPLFVCQGKVASYTFTSTAIEQYNGKTVTVGEASIKFGLRKPVWQSYVEQGVGEVQAVAIGKVTTYQKVSVALIPYAAEETPNSSLTASSAEKSSLPERCDPDAC